MELDNQVLDQTEFYDDDNEDQSSAIAEIVIELEGLTPLVMHNVQLADPDCQWTKAIATITNNPTEKKTEEGRREVAKLEWFGGLYTEKDTIVVPAFNIRRCFQEGAKQTRHGKHILRALTALEVNYPLEYKGPKDLDKLQKNPAFNFRTMIGVKKNKVLRIRPQFIEWRLVTTWMLDLNIIDLRNMQAIAEMTGRIEGLGDARVLGKGRFKATVRKA